MRGNKNFGRSFKGKWHEQIEFIIRIWFVSELYYYTKIFSFHESSNILLKMLEQSNYDTNVFHLCNRISRYLQNIVK